MTTKTNETIKADRTEVAVQRFVRRFGLAWHVKQALYLQTTRRGWDGSAALRVAFDFLMGRPA